MEPVLRKRLLTSAVLIPLLIWGIYGLPLSVFAWVSSVPILLAAWEWSRLSGITASVWRYSYLIAMACALFCSYLILHKHPGQLQSYLILAILTAGLLWWLVAGYWVYRYERSATYLVHNKALLSAIGFLVLIPCWLGLNSLRAEPQGATLVLFLLILVWCADSGAYFAGRYWGLRKLAPRVSPGKTVEGFYGGLLAAVVAAVNAELLLDIELAQLSALVLLVLVTVLLSVVGDLFLSVLKRQQLLKDTGQLLPGHGGVLDRIDSLTAATPIFILGYFLLGH